MPWVPPSAAQLAHQLVAVLALRSVAPLALHLDALLDLLSAVQSAPESAALLATHSAAALVLESGMREKVSNYRILGILDTVTEMLLHGCHTLASLACLSAIMPLRLP